MSKYVKNMQRGNPWHLKNYVQGYIASISPRGTLDQLYTRSRVLEGACEFFHPGYMCFVDLVKAFKCVALGTLSGFSRSMGYCALWYEPSTPYPVQSLVCIDGSKSGLSPILFITLMDRISRCTQGVEGIRFGGPRITYLYFADDVVLLA